MAGAASALFLLDIKGRVLVWRDYRGDVSAIQAEKCFTKLIEKEDKFVKHFAVMVKKAKPIYGTDAVLKVYNIDGDVRIQYKDQAEFETIARQFGIFEEWKDGVPRTAYKGVVVFRYHTPRRVFFVGPDSLQQLGIEQL